MNAAIESRPKNEQAIVIGVSNFEKLYGNFQAVKGISFNIKKGEIFGLIGPMAQAKPPLSMCLAA